MDSEDKGSKQNRGLQIKQLFDQCLDLPKAEQIQLIQDAEVPEDVKNHVKKLLSFTAEEMNLTKAVIDSVQVGLDIKPITVGLNIESYHLVQPLGEGGQGEVWLAERTGDDFHHQVAIKFLKPVHNQKELERFRSERELLASLKHPNIAQLLGGGELADNRPYMIIEYVEGLPLLEYCKENNFNLIEYLNCFLQICDAISYAHSHSVIHRDIKPSNIVVSNDGTVKLLDFGIAKFMDKDDVKTQTLPMMTLAYSSPEQVTGAAVSTASDVYALGLLLYEMLVGQRAQAVCSDAPAELIHEITQQTPIAPSLLIKKIDFNRSYDNKQLKGDLDNLILMAIRKEPNRRYSTVAAMADDIRNYLDGRPLFAVGDSWAYRVKKFVIRNPIVTLLSVTVLIFMVTLPMVLLNNQHQLKQERDKAVLAQEKAQQQSVIANRTTDFLVDILESASPLANKGEAINLDDVLASAERQLSVGMDNQPEIKATLMAKLASIQHHLGHHDVAVKHYKTVLDIYQKQQNISGQVFALGQLAIMSNFADNETESLSYQQQAQSLSNQLTDVSELAWHRARMATLANNMDKGGKSIEALLTESLHELESKQIDNPALFGRLYNELSLLTSDKLKALEYINEALKYAEKLNGRMHPLFQIRQLNKVQRLKNLNRYDEAEAVLLTAKKEVKKLFTTEHSEYASVIAELGSLYHDKGKFSEAEPVYKEAIQISLKLEGEKSLSYVLQLNNLAYLYEDFGQLELAEPMYRKSIELRKKYHSANLMRVASSEGNLARLLAKMGQYSQSQQMMQFVKQTYQNNNRSNTLNTLTEIANVIQPLSESGDCQLGMQMLRQLLPKIQQMSTLSWRRMHSELWLGELANYCQANELAEALLLAAKQKATVIYAEQSDGQNIIFNKVENLINKLP